jgi:hypothetical protein
MKYFLRIGKDYLEEAVPYRTLSEAKQAYREVAEELDRYGQSIEASVHVAPKASEVVEYPDLLLSFKDGRVKGEHC